MKNGVDVRSSTYRKSLEFGFLGWRTTSIRRSPSAYCAQMSAVPSVDASSEISMRKERKDCRSSESSARRIVSRIVVHGHSDREARLAIALGETRFVTTSSAVGRVLPTSLNQRERTMVDGTRRKNRTRDLSLARDRWRLSEVDERGRRH
jgi:hypothetical protein